MFPYSLWTASWTHSFFYFLSVFLTYFLTYFFYIKVREIFTDLATMVEEQDEGLETISENVEKSAIAAKKGRKQLEKANDSQKGRCIVC